jgi:hypothetical protein
MRMLATRSVATACAAFMLGCSVSAIANNEDEFAARLSGYNEVHFISGASPALRGAISTGARGSFKAEMDYRANVIRYELSFEGLGGDVTQAHIHFGQRHSVGGIVVWLCQTAGTPAPAAVAAVTPQCGGPRESIVTGMIGPEQVLDVVGQGIAAAQFDELVRAIRAGATYANVHTTAFAAGEIRGQIGDRKSGHDHH